MPDIDQIVSSTTTKPTFEDLLEDLRRATERVRQARVEFDRLRDLTGRLVEEVEQVVGKIRAWEDSDSENDGSESERSEPDHDNEQ